MSYRIIFLDMDDTLLKNDLTVSPKNKEALKKAIEQQKKVVICTGRAFYSIEKYLDELGLKQYEANCICLNGSTVYNTKTGELILEKTFPFSLYAPVIEAAHKYQIDIQCYKNMDFYVEKVTERTLAYSKKLNAEIKLIDNFLNQRENFSKILLNGERENLLLLEKEIAPILSGKMNHFFSKPYFLEFTPYDATKGQTMIDLSLSLGIKPEETIAVGDSYNDAAMIQMAGLGAAMANGEEGVKKLADYVTKNDNDHDGVAEVIEKFLLDNPTIGVFSLSL